VSNLDEWFVFGLKATGILWLLINTKRIFALIRESFGQIDKAELAGMIFTPVMIWMLWCENARVTEYHRFDDFMFGTVALIVMWGFGLRPLISAVLSLRGVKLQDEKDNMGSANASGVRNNNTQPASGSSQEQL
jgi:hypothetical protein